MTKEKHVPQCIDGSFISFLQPCVSCKLLNVYLLSHPSFVHPHSTQKHPSTSNSVGLFEFFTLLLQERYFTITIKQPITSVLQTYYNLFQTSNFPLPIPSNLPIQPIILYKLYIPSLNAKKTVLFKFHQCSKVI